MIKWIDSYSVGYKKFDDQHKKLIELINKLAEVIENEAFVGDSFYDEIMSVFKEVLDYTTYHFESEEDAFHDSEYDLTEAHEESHEIFVEDVRVLVSELTLGADERETAKKIYDELVAWLVKHIMGEDQKYVGKLSSVE